MNKDVIDRYRSSIRELERERNLTPCDYCGCDHPVRLRIGHDLRITPVYRFGHPCEEYMRDMMSEIRALQNRLGLPENLC